MRPTHSDCSQNIWGLPGTNSDHPAKQIPKTQADLIPKSSLQRGFQELLLTWGSPRPHPPRHTTLSSGRRALLPLVQGKRVLWCLGGWSSRLPFLPPLSLHLRPLLHVPGPHGAEIHSLILRLKIRDAQIPCVLSQVFGAREARGDLGALVLVRVGEISQQESWWVAGPLLVPVDVVNTDIMVAAQRAGQADRGSKGRGHGWWLIQHRLRVTSWGHRSMWASRAKQGKGRGQGP